MLVASFYALGRRERLRRDQEVGVRQHYPFRPRGCPRGVGEEAQIVGSRGLNRSLDVARMRGAEFAPRSLHALEGFEDRVSVGEQAARVVIDDEPQMRQ